MPILALLTAASLEAAFGAGLRSEGRARSPYRGETLDDRVDEVQLDGAIGAGVVGRLWRVFGAYEPRMRANNAGGVVELMHQGRLGAEWTQSATRTLRFEQRGAYGETDFSPLTFSTTPGPPPDRLPPLLTARIMRSATSATWEETPRRGLRLTGTAAWEVTGGADAEARRTIPLQRGPRAGGELSYDLPAGDVLGAKFATSATRFSSGATAYLATVESSLAHRIGTSVTLEGIEGIGAASDGASVHALPLFGARARLDYPRQGLTLEAAGRITPAADWLGSGVYERGEATAGASWRSPGSDFGLGLRAGWGMALTELAGDRGSVSQAELAASWALGPRFSVTAGARGAFVARPIAGENNWQWLGFLAFSALAGEVL